jgi:glutathione synthase/RimK-type ligase-like ATP-grasp enzyme
MTEPVRPRDLVHAEDLRLCPIITQAAIPKALELRATVVGDEVLTVAIHSQQTRHTRHDWRRFDHDRTPITRYALDPVSQQRCRDLVRQLGLAYGAIDLILTPDGRIVFLEINPNGQYLWLELLGGVPISDSVARWLANGGNTERLAA